MELRAKLLTVIRSQGVPASHVDLIPESLQHELAALCDDDGLLVLVNETGRPFGQEFARIWAEYLEGYKAADDLCDQPETESLDWNPPAEL